MELKEFREKLTIYCRINRITYRSIASKIGITEQEFYNMLHGFQRSVKKKGVDDIVDFKQKILEALCIEQL